MSPASYLAAPPRVASGIVADVDWAVYAALIAGIVTVTLGIVHLVRHTLAAWRAFKRLQRELATSLEHLAASAEKTGLAAERVSDQQRLEASLARLNRSLKVFNVLRA